MGKNGFENKWLKALILEKSSCFFFLFSTPVFEVKCSLAVLISDVYPVPGTIIWRFDHSQLRSLLSNQWKRRVFVLFRQLDRRRTPCLHSDELKINFSQTKDSEDNFEEDFRKRNGISIFHTPFFDCTIFFCYFSNKYSKVGILLDV